MRDKKEGTYKNNKMDTFTDDFLFIEKGYLKPCENFVEQNS